MTEPRIDPRLIEVDRRINVESRLLEVVADYGGHRIVAGDVMTAMVKHLATVAEDLAREGWLPASEWEPNDIEATGGCCCTGCSGMGPCDLDLGQTDEDRDEHECGFCPDDCQICSGTPDCDCPTHGEDAP